MELWDIYDMNRTKTNRTIQRGEKLPAGDYHLVVHIWIMNDKKEFLIQKRAQTVTYSPGVWATTGGAVLSGETSREAFLREAKEELGIDVDESKSQLVFSIIRKNSFCDVWFIKDNILLEDLKLQVEEVESVAYATEADILELVSGNNFLNSSYLDDIFQLIPRS